jgi:hypothetical protein
VARARSPASTPPPRPPPPPKPRDSRAVAALKRDAARLRSRVAELEHAERRSKRAAVAAAKRERSAPVAVPFQLVDPRRKPRAGERVLPPLTPPLRIGRAMGAAVVAELRELAIETRRLVRELARQPGAKAETSQVAMDAPPADTPYGGRSVPDEAHRKLDALTERYRLRFDALATEWSARMVTAVTAQSTAQLTLGLKDVAERMEIHATMAEPRVRAIVEAAAHASTQLITRIPEQYLGEVQIAVMSAITTGSGLDKLVPYLTEKYEGDARHAHLVALDQVRKVSENVNAARLQALGVEEFVWIHTGGERYPRRLHQSYSGRTFRYDDPPVIDERTGEKGLPGAAINCRCRQRAILRFMRASEQP